MRNNEKLIREAILNCLRYLPEDDMTQALSEIIFAPDTIINWDNAADVLMTYVPDMIDDGFAKNTITYQELSDYLNDEDIFDDDELFDYYENANPNESITFEEAIDNLYQWFRFRFTEDDDTTNYAYAVKIARGAFKRYNGY